MITIDTKDAKKIERGISKSNYIGWQEYAYNRAVICPLDEDTYIEHRKDRPYCSIKGKEYGYRGEIITSCEVRQIEDIKYLCLITDTNIIYLRIEDEEDNVDD